MRHITTLLILIFSTSIFAQNNVVKTAGVSYTAGAPTFSPGRTGSQVAIDTVTGLWYEHNGTSWSASGYRVQTISGCSAPAYTPEKYQSRLVINACSAGQGGPELYYWTGSVWLQINEGQTYTAGTGIDITGTTITNTAPNVVQELSISGQDLTLSGGGGTVTLPGGSGGGVSIYISATAPPDTSKIWANSSLQNKGAYPIFYYRPGGWIQNGQYYDRLAGQIGNGLPLNILDFGQSNIVGPFPNTRSVDSPGYLGDSTSSRMVIAVDYNGAWRRAVAAIWPPIFVTSVNGATHSMVAAKRIAEKTGRTVRIIVCGQGGQPIEYWRPGATGWQELDSTLQRAYRSGMGKVDAAVWFHGEAGSTANTYQAQWDSLVARLRTRQYWDSTGTMILAPSNALAITDAFPGSIVAENTLRALDYDGDPATKYIRPLERKETNTLNDVFHYTPREHERIGRVYADAILSWEYRDRADGVLRLNGTSSVTTIFPRQDSVIWRINLRTNNVGAFQRRYSFAGSNNSTFVENLKSTGGSSAFQLEWYFEASATTPVAYMTSAGLFSNKPLYAIGAWDQTATPSGGLVFSDVGGVGNDILIAKDASGNIVYNCGQQAHSFRYQNSEKFGVNSAGPFAPLITISGTGAATAPTGIVFNNPGGTANDVGVWQSATDALGIIYKSGTSGVNTATHRWYFGDTNLFSLDQNSGSPKMWWLGKFGVGTSSPAASASAEISSTTGGFLPPRMTSTQRDAISSPATGLTLYCTDCTATDSSTGVQQVYNGSTWKNAW